MSNITITTETPPVPVTPRSQTVNGKRLPMAALQTYMGRKARGEKLGREFWAQLRRELQLNPNRKYKVRIVGVVLEK
jgi:hypothetical protein